MWIPTYQKVSAAKFDRSGHAQPLLEILSFSFGSFSCLHAYPSYIISHLHLPSLEGWVSPTACPSRVVKTSPMAVLAALPSTCWKDQYIIGLRRYASDTIDGSEIRRENHLGCIYIYTLGAGGSPGTPAPRGFIYMKLGWGWGGVGWGW